MHVGQPKIVATTALLLSKMPPEAISEHLISKNVLGEHPPGPLVLCACLLIYMHTYAYIHIRHRRNPLSKIPGYGPGLAEANCASMLTLDGE